MSSDETGVKRHHGIWFETIIFALASLIYIYLFSQRTDVMSLDAQLTATISNYHLETFGRIFSLRTDFLFGLGGLQGGFLFWLDPISIVGSIGADVYNHILVALFASTAIFCLTRVLLKSLGQAEMHGRLCAVLTSMATIWGYSIALVDNELFGHVPQYASLLICSLGILCCFTQFTKKSGIQAGLWGVGFVILVLYLFVALPHLLITAIPLLVFVILSIIIFSAKDRESKTLLRQSSLVVFTIAILFILKAPSFLLGFYKNTAAAEILTTPYDQPQIQPVYRFVFQAFFSTPSALGNYWFQILAFFLLLFYLIVGIVKSQRRDQMWLATMLASGFLLGYRIWQSSWELESGPRISYFAWMLAPLYAIGVSYSLVDLSNFMRKLFMQLAIRVEKIFQFLVLAALTTAFLVSPFTSLRFSRSEPSSPRLSELRGETLLEDEISLRNDLPFRGRAVYLFKQPNYPEDISSRIPLLNDYSHNVTPRAFSFYSKFIFDEDSNQTRLRYVFGSRNPLIYQMLGVKFFLLSDDDVDFVSDSFGETIKSVTDLPSNNSLIELLNANVGNYSPTIVHTTESLNATFEKVSSSGFDPTVEIVLRKQLSQNLVAATSSSLSLANGDLLLTAKSTGSSIILLPLEFSSCLEFEPIRKSEGLTEVLLADGLLTAVLFDKEVELKIKLRYGIFENSECRYSDLKDYRSANN